MAASMNMGTPSAALHNTLDSRNGSCSTQCATQARDTCVTAPPQPAATLEVCDSHQACSPETQYVSSSPSDQHARRRTLVVDAYERRLL